MQEVGGKKINKAQWPHSVSSQPVAEIANEQTITALGTECWVLGATR